MSWLFWAGIIFTVVAPIVIGVGYDDQSTSWIAAICGAFVTFMSRLEFLAELSLGPVKAKLRDKIEEATATIDQLRNVAVVSAEATLTDLMAGGFMGGMNTRMRLELHDKIVHTLAEIEADELAIEAAKSEWNKGISIIYHRAISRVVDGRSSPNLVNPDSSDQQKKAYKELQSILDFDTWTVPTPNQIRAILKKYDIESEEVNHWLDDYENFLSTGEILRRSEFEKE